MSLMKSIKRIWSGISDQVLLYEISVLLSTFPITEHQRYDYKRETKVSHRALSR